MAKKEKCNELEIKLGSRVLFSELSKIKEVNLRLNYFFFIS